MTPPYSQAFREQALAKVYSRGTQTVRGIATELNINYETLKGWMKSQPRQKPEALGGARRRAQDWSAAQRLQALCETHALDQSELSAWCRREGLYEHHLIAWRKEFETPTPNSASAERSEYRELKEQKKQLQRELNRKDKALAEAAALLVLQKKYQALWEEKDA